MSSSAVSDQAESQTATVPGVDMKLEVVVLPVADVDRAKEFYAKLGWRLDADLAPKAGFRIVQLTPPHSQTSIIFGEGIGSAAPGSIDTIVLVVDDIEAARDELAVHGVDVSDVFYGPGAGFERANPDAQMAGRDSEGGSYSSWASFSDPDGNGWLLQQITRRLAGRGGLTNGVSGLAELLRETAEHHDAYEKTHGQHDWWDWYAPYMDARQNGSTPEQAASAADQHMEELARARPR